MIPPPQPVIFEPRFQPRPWGGRRLEAVLRKHLPAESLIGESWELSDLPGQQTTVRAGPLAGATLKTLAENWGPELLFGTHWKGAERFPILLKYLDAREHLSIQVHPRADLGRPQDAKDEAWYVLAADPGAEVLIGLRPGVTRKDVADCAGTAAMTECLQRWPARPGDLYFLPSGVVHALGAGVLVAEVQTPADVTYRLYDWERRDPAGRRRELHIDAALVHLQDGPGQGGPVPETTLETTGFTLTRCTAQQIESACAPGQLSAWMVIRGFGELAWDHGTVSFELGDTLLLPAGGPQVRRRSSPDLELLLIRPLERAP